MDTIEKAKIYDKIVEIISNARELDKAGDRDFDSSEILEQIENLLQKH